MPEILQMTHDATEEFFTKPHPLMNDTWLADGDTEFSMVHTVRIADTTRAANGISTIARLCHNSLGQPDMSGAQPLDIGTVQHLLNAAECLAMFIGDQMEEMRDSASRYSNHQKQMEAARG